MDLEAQCRFDESFQFTMIRFDRIVEVFDLSVISSVIQYSPPY